MLSDGELGSAKAGYNEPDEKLLYPVSKSSSTVVQLANEINQSLSRKQSHAELRKNSNGHPFSLTRIMTSIVIAFGRAAESSPYLLLPHHAEDEREEDLGLPLHQNKAIVQSSLGNSQDRGSRES